VCVLRSRLTRVRGILQSYGKEIGEPSDARCLSNRPSDD